MHSSGSITRIRSNSWMQSTGQTSTHERSLMSMQGSAMMYVKAGSVYRGKQLVNQLRSPLVEGRFRDHLVEARLVGAAQSGRVGVVREAEQRHVRIVVRDVRRIDPRHVCDHQLGRVGAVRGNETMTGERGLQLAPDVEIDPNKQDRRHG